MNPLLKRLIYIVLGFLLPLLYSWLNSVLPEPIPIPNDEFVKYILAIIGAYIGGWQSLKFAIMYRSFNGFSRLKWNR